MVVDALVQFMEDCQAMRCCQLDPGLPDGVGSARLLEWVDGHVFSMHG